MGSIWPCSGPPREGSSAPHVTHGGRLLQQHWSRSMTGLLWPPPAEQRTGLSPVPGLEASSKPPTHIRSSGSGINFIIVFSKTILQHVVLYPYAFCKCNTKNDEMIYNSYLFLLLANSMLYSEKHSPRQVNRMYFSTVV